MAGRWVSNVGTARALLLAAAVLLAGCTSTTAVSPNSAPSATPTTQAATKASSWPLPNRRLTPGAVTPGCTYPRPKSERAVPDSEKRAIATKYHMPWPVSPGTEFDHLVQFADCGSNGPDNVWPEPYDGAPRSAFVHNRKDQLEQVLSHLLKVKHWGARSLATVQAIELAPDWRVQWCLWVTVDVWHPVTCDLP